MATLVTSSVYTHADWSADTKDMAVHLVPGMRVHFKAEALRKLLGSLAVYLCPGNAFSFEDGVGIIKLRRSTFKHLGGSAAGRQSYAYSERQ
jgi:hypothetical protein